MDRCVDTNFEQQTIYQIYRACRLCGAGAGYKMPIIQNVVDLDGRDVELRQKIRECVQIEVSQDDKMPPLICELCVDKVNDFYEFFDMCRQTNKRTRHRLGLPPQTLPRGAMDDCILGLTEPVYVNEDSNEPISRHRSKVQKAKVKKEPESKSKVVVKVEEKSLRRLTRASVPSPPPAARETRRSDAHGKKAPTPLKSILKKEKDIKAEDNGLSRSKRSREDTPEMPTKRVKIAAKPVVRSVAKAVAKPSAKPVAKNVAKPSPKNLRAASNPAPREQRAPSAKLHFACHICAKEFPSSLSLAVHQRIHQVKQLKNSRCVTKETRSPSRTRGGKCDKCGRTYLTRKNFLRHESYCTFKKKVSQAVVEPAVLRSLRRVQVRVARCDALLAARGRCRVADLPQEYGLDQRCVYPYISSVRSLRIKSEPGDDFMVDIGEGIKQELEDVGYVHWDSDDSSDQEDSERDFAPKKRTPEPLSTLALKTVFSQRCLGKVPRKRRRIKAEMPVADRFDDVNDLERIGEDISDKVASIDGLLGDVDDVDTVEKTGTEECRAQNGGEVDCGLMEVVGSDCCSVKLERVVGDATGDVSQKSMSSYSPRLEINGDESNAENEMDVSEEVNGELSNTNIKEIKTEMNISIDNVNESIVNNEENNIEVAEKEKIGSDCNQKNSSTEDGVATDEPSQEMGDSYVDSNIVEASDSIRNKEVSSEIKIEENDLAQETDDAQTARETDADEISADETSRNVDAERDGEFDERKSNIPSERDSNNSDERDSNVPDEKDSNVADERESNIPDERDSNNFDGQESNFPDERDSNIRDEQDSNIPDERDSNVSGERRGNIPDGFETEWQSVMAEEIEAGDRAASTNGIDAATKREDEIMGEFDASQGYDGERANVNGREQIDAELEDRRLMEALDAQIGECEGDGACDRDKITLADLLPDKAHEKSLDLDGMADEFAFDP